MEKSMSRSQAGQDWFAYNVLSKKTDGTFLEIGGCHPVEINNTYELERLGWRGYSFDHDPGTAPMFAQQRPQCKFYLTDVTTFDWNGFCEANNLVGGTIDYLSFDVDDASMKTLQRFPFSKVKFNVMTVEHDRYRFGVAVAEEMRSILTKHGYVILCKDITNGRLPYEDWWVHRDFLAANPQLEAYRTDLAEWTEVMLKLA
jgi:hypothetical protein